MVIIGILFFFYFFLNRRKETKKTKETTMTPPDFIASDKFNGEKKGYIFKNCNEGLGYYKDTLYLIQH